MKRVENIKQELSLIGNDDTQYDVCITGDIKIEAGFEDKILVYGHDIEDDLIYLDVFCFDCNNEFERHYKNGATIHIVRKPVNN